MKITGYSPHLFSHLPCKVASSWHHCLRHCLCWFYVFIVMAFTKEDKVVIKFLRETKRYGAKRFLSEFATKPWSLSGLKWLINKIDDTGYNFWSNASLLVSHIAHGIRDRTELVTHCFSQNCSLVWFHSAVWNLCCMWCSISWYASCWNFIKFCCLQWKLYTKT